MAVAEAGGSISSTSNQLQANAPLPVFSKIHHDISNSLNNPVDLFTFLQENDSNPAVKVEGKAYIVASYFTV
jgi:hypothetical protein